MRQLVALGVLCGFAPGALAQPPAGEVIDRAAAAVEGQVITLSELEFETRVLLIQQGAEEAATAPLDADVLRSSLDVAIGNRLQNLEADKLQAFPVDEAELARALEAFSRRFPSATAFQAFLDRHDADVTALASVLARQLRASKILDSKVRLKAQVTDADVRRYYEENAHKLGGTFELLRDALREKLVRDRYAQLVAAELAQERRGADVRLIAPFARRGGHSEGRRP